MRTLLSKTLLFFFSLTPLPVAHGVGYLLGHLLWWFDGRLKNVTVKNISLCYPHLSPQQQKHLCRKSMIELAKTATETGILWRAGYSRLNRLVRKTFGEETLRQAMAQQKGIIIVSPHFGAWELVGLYCSKLAQMTTLYKPPKLAGLERTTLEARQKYGAKTVPTDSNGVRQLYQALKNKEFIGILPDQDPGEGGVFAPFFGIQTNTMVLLPRLASKFHTPVFFVAAKRLSWGRGYELHFLPCPDNIYSKDLLEAVTQANKSVEQCVALSPAQYQWSYKRFKTRLEGEQRFY